MDVAMVAAASPDAAESLVRGRTATDGSTDLAAQSMPNVVIVGSGALLLLGLALFGLRFAATRLR